MTETEWLSVADPEPMLDFVLRGMIVYGFDDLRTRAEREALVQFVRGRYRKLRLFACACCRHVWNLLGDERCRSAIEVMELVLEGKADLKQLDGTMLPASLVTESMKTRGHGEDSTRIHLARVGARAARAAVHDDIAGAARDCADAADWAGLPNPVGTSRAYQAALLRDILGNPFRLPRSVDVALLAWNDGTVRTISERIYEDWAFDQLPVLADALEDAGCADANILAHCRGPGPHVRGCWVVDLILGKQ
jgi:hypothetical protein